MAKIWCFSGTRPLLPLQNQFRRNNGVNIRRKIYGSLNRDKERETAQTKLLKIAVSGVTELLRIFSPSSNETRLEKQIDEFPASTIDDVLSIIKSDYDKAYFATGNFTSSIYAENCMFEDPTIKFRGRDLYARNLKLLVPFFDCASIILLKIDKVALEKLGQLISTNSFMNGATPPEAKEGLYTEEEGT